MGHFHSFEETFCRLDFLGTRQSSISFLAQETHPQAKMQSTLFASALLALVASALALQVTAPAQGSNLDLSTDNTISWASVSTDPSNFNIVLTNNNVNPPLRIEIASNVETSTGSYDVSSVSGATPGANYQINLEGTSASNQGILAQSGQFNVADAGSSSTSSASFSSSTPSTSGVTSSTFATLSDLLHVF